MNNKRVAVLLLVIIVILGVSASFAKVEYQGSLTQVYGTGSCDTCHVDGPKDGPRTAYGTLFENQTNHAKDSVAALKTIGAPPTAALVETGTSAATATLTATPEVTTAAAKTTETTTETAKSPGFGIIVSMVGLIAWALFERRKN